jgi:hypothetical protein
MMICLSDKSFEFQSEVSIVYQDENEIPKKKSELDWFVQLSKTQDIPQSEFNLKKLEDWPIVTRDD